MRHKWNDNDECKVCGILRERATYALRMAIVGNRDIYQYTTKYRYIVEGKETWSRPECTPPKRYDD